MKRLVESVMSRRAELLHDLESLESAIAMEAALDDPGGRRHERLSAVADAQKAELQSLTDALRDLHVELTVQGREQPGESEVFERKAMREHAGSDLATSAGDVLLRSR